MAEAQDIEDAAAVTFHRVHGFLARTKDQDRDAFAKTLGWQSADALTAFLFDGPSAGDVH